MSKGKGRVPMSVPLMEKEIRRLTMLGQRVETEANLRRNDIDPKERPALIDGARAGCFIGKAASWRQTLALIAEIDALRAMLKEAAEEVECYSRNAGRGSQLASHLRESLAKPAAVYALHRETLVEVVDALDRRG